MFYDPVKLALWGVVAWFVVWLITPVDVTGDLAIGALLYTVVGYALLIAGATMARRPEMELPGAFPNEPWDKSLHLGLFWWTTGLGAIGMALRSYDRIFLRGVEYGANALEFREALANSSSSWAGITGGVLFPLCLIPLMLLFASTARKSKPLLAVSIIVFALPVVESLFQLSRSFLILSLGLAFATVVITRYRGRPVNRRLVTISLAGMLAMLLASTVIFSARLEAGEARLSDSVFDSVYAAWLQPNQAAREAISSGSDAEAFVTLAVLPNGMYYISGLYEFSALWLRPDGQVFANGQISFYPFVRVIYSVLGIDQLTPDQVEDYVYRDGVFQTFFGPLWVDFGWIGPFLLFPFGYLIKRLSYRVRAGSVAVLPIYVYLAIVIFFMPVVNFLTGGLGMLAVLSFVTFAVVAAHIRAKTMVSASQPA